MRSSKRFHLSCQGRHCQRGMETPTPCHPGPEDCVILKRIRLGQVVGMEQKDWDKCGAQADGGQGDSLAPGYSPWE